MHETKVLDTNIAQVEPPVVTIIGIVAKRKKVEEEDRNKKQCIEENEEITKKVAACHTIKALADYVRTLLSIQGRTEKFTGEFVAKLIMTPNINANIITKTYNIRKQFTTITKHAEKIHACNSIDEIILYLELNLPAIPTSATKDGALPAKKLIKLLNELSENKDLVKAVPSAYGLREKVSLLITQSPTPKT